MASSLGRVTSDDWLYRQRVVVLDNSRRDFCDDLGLERKLGPVDFINVLQ